MRFNCLRCDAEFIKSNLDWAHKCVCGLILKINKVPFKEKNCWEIGGWEINLGKYSIFTLFFWDKNRRIIRIEDTLTRRCLVETQYISPKFLSQDKIEKIFLLR